MIFKALVLQALYNLSDDQAEYQLRDRFSFVRPYMIFPAFHASRPALFPFRLSSRLDPIKLFGACLEFCERQFARRTDQ